nr:hypothetical protein [Pseudanabaena sp. PCC 6802]
MPTGYLDGQGYLLPASQRKWIFGLSAECGSDEGNAHKFAEHFEGISWLLSNGRHCQCCTDIFQDIEKNWWCRVSPNNLSEVGIDSPESAYLMTELGILLYQSLRFAPPFRYVLVGVEVDEFRFKLRSPFKIPPILWVLRNFIPQSWEWGLTERVLP